MINLARPPAGTLLCALDEIESPGAKGFVFRQGSDLFAGFVLRNGETVRGYVDSCPHNGWPLTALPDRYLTRDEKWILCSGHGALFDPKNGECVSGPCYGESLEAWPVALVDGEVRAA